MKGKRFSGIFNSNAKGFQCKEFTLTFNRYESYGGSWRLNRPWKEVKGEMCVERFKGKI